MKFIDIIKPIDYFIAFEEWNGTLNKLHNDHYFRCMCVYKMMHFSILITTGGYDKALQQIYPGNESFQVTLESIAQASAYRALKSVKEKITIAYALIETVQNQPSLNIRSDLRKKISRDFEEDTELQEIVSYIKNLTFGSLTSFKPIKQGLAQRYSRNILFQKMYVH
jgi:hypothetical protein